MATIHAAQLADAKVIKLQGSIISADEVPGLIAQIRREVQGCARIVIDLSDVTSAPTAFLVGLSHLNCSVSESEGQMKLCGVQQGLLTGLEEAGMSRVFTILPDREAALSSWR